MDQEPSTTEQKVGSRESTKTLFKRHENELEIIQQQTEIFILKFITVKINANFSYQNFVL